MFCFQIILAGKYIYIISFNSDNAQRRTSCDGIEMCLRVTNSVPLLNETLKEKFVLHFHRIRTVKDRLYLYDHLKK